MNKYGSKILFFLLFFLFLPITVRALPTNYDIEELQIEAHVLSNGDVLVNSWMLIDGTFHDYQTEITYKDSRLDRHENIDLTKDAIYNAEGLENISIGYSKITEENVGTSLKDLEYTMFTKVFYENDAVNGNYLESSTQNGKNYKLFYEAKNEKTVLYFTYTLKDVVVLHEDIAEIYFPFINDKIDDKIQSTTIKVYLPKKSDESKLHAWLHGDITGNISITDNNLITTTINKLANNNAIKLRITMDKNIINNINTAKLSHQNSLEKIIDLEEERTRIENKENENLKKINFTINTICKVHITIIIISWLVIIVNYYKKNKIKNIIPVKPADIKDVELIEYLLYHKVTNNAFIASLLSLIKRRNILVKEKDNTLIFTLVNKKNITELEEQLINILFINSKNNKTTIESINDYASNNNTAYRFNKLLNNWFRSTLKTSLRKKYFESNGIAIVWSIFSILIEIFILLAAFYFSADPIFAIINLCLSIILLLFSLNMKKRTIDANKLYSTLCSYKSYIEQIKETDIKNLSKNDIYNIIIIDVIFGNVKLLENTLLSLNCKNEWVLLKLASNLSESFISIMPNINKI